MIAITRRVEDLGEVKLPRLMNAILGERVYVPSLAVLVFCHEMLPTWWRMWWGNRKWSEWGKVETLESLWSFMGIAVSGILLAEATGQEGHKEQMWRVGERGENAQQ